MKSSFGIVVIFFATHKSPELRFQLLPIWQIQLISAYEDLVGDILQCIMHNQFILVSTKNDADRLSIPLRIHLLTVVIQIEVHLSDILMLNFPTFQVNQNKALQDPMVEYQIDLICPSANHHFLLSSHISETLLQVTPVPNTRCLARASDINQPVYEP